MKVHLKFVIFSISILFITPALTADPEFVWPEVFNDPERDALIYGKFPDDFVWSSATSAYQIEGAWNVSDKGESIWDRWTHLGGRVAYDQTGDIACDSYTNFKYDVKAMVKMGLKYYRFSISWPRVLPDGTLNAPSADGLRYYNDLIDELVANDISPMVTLYHWDLPQALQDNGGWESDSIVEAFANYADYCFKNFGDRAKLWITFNEPWIVSMLGYGCGGFAPGICGDGTISYVVAHNIIKSHAHAWHIYNDIYRSSQNGQLGITLNSDFQEPYDRSNPVHVDAAERILQFGPGWFGHPIFIDGDYPEVMKTNVAEKSMAQGLSKSRLPEFTEDEKNFIKGTGDFLGLNHYTTSYAVDTEYVVSDPPSYYNDQNAGGFKDDSWPKTGSSWLQIVPWGIRRLLVWLDNEYKVPIYVTENGVSTKDVYELEDTQRVNYYKSYINEVLKAIKIDKANVKGYTAWSLMDNFEWGAGYTERFGIHYVDFDDPDRLPRERKASADYLTQIIADNGFVRSGGSSVTVTSVFTFLISLFVYLCCK